MGPLYIKNIKKSLDDNNIHNFLIFQFSKNANVNECKCFMVKKIIFLFSKDVLN